MDIHENSWWKFPPQKVKVGYHWSVSGPLMNWSAQEPHCLAQPRGRHAFLLPFPPFFPHSLPFPCLPWPLHWSPRPGWGATHHLDRPEGHEPVTAVAAWPCVPARVLTLLQDKHLPPEVGLLKGDPAERERDREGQEEQRQKEEQPLAEGS